MSVDFTSESGDEFFLSNAGWRYLVEVAKVGGFQWPRDASGDEVDRLTASQAVSLADAIDAIIGTGDATDVATRVSAELHRRLVDPHPSPMFDDRPLQFGAKMIESWREFVAFARRAGFEMNF